MSDEWEIIDTDSEWEIQNEDGSWGKSSIKMVTPPPRDYSTEGAINLAQQTGSGEAVLTSAGREMNKIVEGAKDEYDNALYTFTSNPKYRKSSIERQKQQDELDKLYGPLQEEKFWSTIGGSILPYLATMPAGFARGPSAVKSTAESAPTLLRRIAQGAVPRVTEVGREAAIGGTTGGLHYDDTAAEGSMFGAGGAAAGKWIGNLLAGTKQRLIGDMPRLIERAKELDIFLPPGMRTNIRTQQQLDRAIETHARTADTFAKRIEDSKKSEVRAISREELGEETDSFSREYIDGMLETVRNNINDLTKDVDLSLSEDDLFGINDILTRLKETSATGTNPGIFKTIENKLLNAVADGRDITGDEFTRLKEALARISAKPPGGDEYVSKAASDINDIIDQSIISRSGNTDLVEALAKEKNKQKLLRDIEDVKTVSSTKGLPGSTGYIDPIKLNKRFPGSPIIQDLAEIEQFRKSQPGSSLSMSGILGRALLQGGTHPTDSFASLLVSGSSVPKGGFIDKTLTEWYLSGWPHVTGLVPGAKNVREGITKLPSRLMMSNEDKEGAEEKRRSIMDY